MAKATENKKLLTYHEIDFAIQVLKANDPVDSHKKKYLDFLEELTDSTAALIEEKKAKNGGRVVDNEISISIAIPEHVKAFLKEKVEGNAVYTLHQKLSE